MPVTVLLVEDDVRQSDAMRSLFEESSPDTSVIVAKTLKEAVRYDRAAIDAVLLDLGLPDSSGLDTLTVTLGRFAPVPVIVLTGTADTETGERAIALGAEDYLNKAVIPPAAIRRVVRHAIRHYAERKADAQRDAQNRAVGQLGQLALTNLSSATLLGTICEVVADVLAGTSAMFVERSLDGFRIAKRTAGSTAASWSSTGMDDESPLGEAIRTNRSVRVDDVRKSGASATTAILRQLDAVSLAVIPVRTTFTAADGLLVVWRQELRPFNDQDFAFLHAVSNILASTVQRNATQEALRLSREQMERILDAIPDRIFRFDQHFRVQFMNRPAARSLPSVVLGMHIDEFPVPAEHRMRWRSSLERALATGVAERVDKEVVVVLGGDVTERVRAQARYETLLRRTWSACSSARRMVSSIRRTGGSSKWWATSRRT